MKFQNQPIEISQDTNLQLEAISVFWQENTYELLQLEAFITANFKRPTGGSWDLDSLWEDLLVQYGLTPPQTIFQSLPKVIADRNDLPYHPATASVLLENEIVQRYEPILNTKKDRIRLKQLSLILEAMEAVQLGVFGEEIPRDALPTEVILFFDENHFHSPW